jgi:hypothetical protein
METEFGASYEADKKIYWSSLFSALALAISYTWNVTTHYSRHITDIWRTMSALLFQGSSNYSF